MFEVVRPWAEKPFPSGIPVCSVWRITAEIYMVREIDSTAHGHDRFVERARGQWAHVLVFPEILCSRAGYNIDIIF
jgi:hypothetical protein